MLFPFSIANIEIEEGLHMVIKPDDEFRETLKAQLEEKVPDELVEKIAKAIHEYY